jgi:hypothetical protein
MKKMTAIPLAALVFLFSAGAFAQNNRSYSDINGASPVLAEAATAKAAADYKKFITGGVKNSSDTTGYAAVRTGLHNQYRHLVGAASQIKREAAHIDKIKSEFLAKTKRPLPGEVRVNGSSKIYYKNIAPNRTVVEVNGEKLRFYPHVVQVRRALFLVKTDSDYFLILLQCTPQKWMLEGVLEFSEKEINNVQLTNWHNFTTPLKEFFGIY